MHGLHVLLHQVVRFESVILRVILSLKESEAKPSLCVIIVVPICCHKVQIAISIPIQKTDDARETWNVMNQLNFDGFLVTLLTSRTTTRLCLAP